jgi:hypothetical protein
MTTAISAAVVETAAKAGISDNSQPILDISDNKYNRQQTAAGGGHQQQLIYNPINPI